MSARLDPDATADVLDRLGEANRAFAEWYPGEPSGRQPIHTVYGGAQLYKATTTNKLGELALKHMDKYGPDAETFCGALGIESGSLAKTVYERTRAKLETEAVEDFRIDFEDGYGNRPDAEEDAEAVRTAIELSRAWNQGDAPPFIGIRVKPLTEELKARSIRTLDLFVSTLADRVSGDIPEGFVITLPKVTLPEQAAAFAQILSQLEVANDLPEGTLKLELMIETTQALMDRTGKSALPGLLAACRDRCVAAHLGTYDFTASANITARYQTMDHPVCDLAKQQMTLAYAQTGIFLSDGATNVMPVGDEATVHAAWRLAYGHIRHSLEGGFYQGWDLHPGQLPIRYAACYAFFLEGYDAASERLGNFINKAAQATLVGDVFDDAATGQGLLNYFLRALNCGAVTIEEVEATGLTLEEIQARSFVKILETRRKI